MLRTLYKIFIPAFFISTIVLTGCMKEGHEKPESKILCRIIAADSIPLVVRDSFMAKYAKIIPNRWFIKDTIGFCADFTYNGKQQLVLFSSTGVWLNEETKVEQTGQFEDSTGQQGKLFSEGCSCEISTEHD
ncbi:hypothetical protein, partial [Hydrotalea sp.]|uniref:hypothetical protein n=1 Tax=Hydrotalea sp. TaxID=2881279 RepID=UPI002620AFD2